MWDSMLPTGTQQQTSGSKSSESQDSPHGHAKSDSWTSDEVFTSPTVVEPIDGTISSHRNVDEPGSYMTHSERCRYDDTSGVTSDSVASLRLRTDLATGRPISPMRENDGALRHSLSTNSLPRRTPSYSTARWGAFSSTDSLSPASVISSPQLAAMGDITPLPSPIGVSGISPWLLARSNSQSLSRASSTTSRSGSSWNLRLSESSHGIHKSTSKSRSKPYTGITRLDEDGTPKPLTLSSQTGSDSQGRSVSDYIPPKPVSSGPRPVAVSGSGPSLTSPTSKAPLDESSNLHREEYLAVQRGIAPSGRPLTPPRSTKSSDESGESLPTNKKAPAKDHQDEVYFVKSIRTQHPRKYRKIGQLGQGTFSQVSLGVRISDEESGDSRHRNGMADWHPNHTSSQKLVAVKVIELGPAGGADEDRVEVSLKREVEILKAVNHPSVVQLKAFGSDDKRALLVLDYCPGGDLFEFATSGMKILSNEIIRRIFAELVAAVRYLHDNYIVHRDIKLENVLVNIPAAAMRNVSDWRTYDRAVVTLSDLGLSRRIPEPPESPLLHTRCGSEDYAAPEILMGQPYDGRSTDAWALGVLLYAMMESRLPFDALPGTRGDPAKLRARTPHRIARCEWSWYRHADEDGEWDSIKGKGLEGARECVEGLLKRNTRRKRLEEIAVLGYVHEAIDVPDGLKRGDKETP